MRVTPEQLHNNVFLLGSVGSALLLETIGWLRAPERIAAMAFVPLFSRRIPMGPRTRAELAAPDGQASYRSAARGGLDWSRLPGPRRFERQGVRFELDPSRARLVARLPFTPTWFGFGGVAALRLRVEGDVAVVEARALPWLSLTSVAFFGALLVLVGPSGPRAIGALFAGLLVMFNGLATWRTRRVFASAVRAGADELAARVAP